MPKLCFLKPSTTAKDRPTTSGSTHRPISRRRLHAAFMEVDAVGGTANYPAAHLPSPMADARTGAPASPTANAIRPQLFPRQYVGLRRTRQRNTVPSTVMSCEPFFRIAMTASCPVPSLFREMAENTEKRREPVATVTPGHAPDRQISAGCLGHRRSCRSSRAPTRSSAWSSAGTGQVAAE
jgi:hypothetical protein